MFLDTDSDQITAGMGSEFLPEEGANACSDVDIEGGSCNFERHSNKSFQDDLFKQAV